MRSVTRSHPIGNSGSFILAVGARNGLSGNEHIVYYGGLRYNFKHSIDLFEVL
jgi:hypothetical protein